MIRSSTYSATPFEEDRPEDFGFENLNGRYQKVYRFISNTSKPANNDLTLSFPTDSKAIEKVQTCNQLFEAIRDTFQYRAGSPDTWPSTNKQLKIRRLLQNLSSKGVEMTSENISLVRTLARYRLTLQFKHKGIDVQVQSYR